MQSDPNHHTPSAGKSRRDFEFVLVLSGGNALGAFQAGVYEALDNHDLQPDWIIGTSTGAVNGALIAGSAPDQRIAKLRAFWRPEAPITASPGGAWMSDAFEAARRTGAVSWTMVFGRPGVFGPLLSSLLPVPASRPALFETEQLEATLDKMVDFERLNGSNCRFTVTAVDLESGDDVVFDTRDRFVGSRHIRASTAMPVTFPPVEVDGRWLVDGGVSANLPLDPLLGAPPSHPVLCLAVDLLPLSAMLPKTVGEAASRLQDLVFAAQSRRSIERWRDHHDGRKDLSVVLVRTAYQEDVAEVAGKAMDFSGQTIGQRWSDGYAAGEVFAKAVEQGLPELGVAGLSVIEL